MSTFELDGTDVAAWEAGGAPLLDHARRFAMIGSWNVDLSTRVLTWNDEMYRIYGATRSQHVLAWTDWLAATHPDDRTLVAQAHAASAASGAPIDFIHRVFTPDGGVNYVHVRGQTRYDRDGAPVRSVGTAQNVPRAVLHEQSQRVGEGQLQAIFAAMSEGLVIHGEDGHVIDANPAAESILGLTRDELLGRTSMDPRWHAIRADGAPFPGVEHPAIVTLRTGKPVRDVIMGVQDPRRGLRWVSINANPVQRDDQRRPVAAVATFVDITERRTVEAQLNAASAELHDLYDNSPCGHHSIDADGKFVRINETTLAWLGQTREQVIGKKTPMDFFTEAGREQFRQNFPILKASGRIADLEFDLVPIAGPTRRVCVSATAVIDDQGRFVMSRTVMYDITELHLARSRLREMAQEQRAMLDNDMVGIVKLRNRRAVWKNKALERIFGYAPDELQDQPARLLYPDDEAHRAFGAAAYPVLSAGGCYRAQIQMVRKDGAPIWIDISGVLLSADRDESMWILADITPLRRSQEKLERIAFYDPLTALPNRLLLADRLKQALPRAERHGTSVAVCYLDLDGFKPVNDTFGHGAGDLVLEQVARRLECSVRANDTVARLGGDEFVLLLTDLAQASDSDGVLRRLLTDIEQPVALQDGRFVRVSATIGVAFFPAHATQPDLLIRNADRAMYEAKKRGRRRIGVYDKLADCD